MVKFGLVGLVALAVDVYVFNLLRAGWWPATSAPLGHKVVTAAVIATSVATVVAWLGNRLWTFQGLSKRGIRAEFIMFALVNGMGLLISATCLAFSHYALGLNSVLADNLAKNVVGLALASGFRFWAYRSIVFAGQSKKAAAQQSEQGCNCCAAH